MARKGHPVFISGESTSITENGRFRLFTTIWRPQRINHAAGRSFAAMVLAGLIGLGTLGLNGCATSPKSKANADVLKVTITTCPYQITPLDTVTLTSASGEVKELTVGHDGTIPIAAGREKVAGLSVAEFKSFLAKNFPDVSAIEIHEFKDDRISVLGEVFHQIHTQLGSGPMRLMDAVAAANGFTSLANKAHVRVVRENAGTVETYEIDFRQLLRGENMQQNILIKPGDVITVPRDFL